MEPQRTRSGGSRAGARRGAGGGEPAPGGRLQQAVLGSVARVLLGDVWADDALPKRTRSLINLAILAAMNRQPQFRTHLKGAFNNGCTLEEIQAVLIQVSVYCGIPAGSEAFRQVARRSTSRHDDAGAPEVRRFDHLVDGRSIVPASGEYLTGYDPRTATPAFEFARGNAADVDVAVRSAKEAFPAWRDRSPAERAQVLLDGAQVIRRNAVGPGRDRGHRDREAGRHGRVGGPRRRGLLPVLRRRARRVPWTGHRPRTRASRLHAQGALRRGRRHPAVEQPPPPARVAASRPRSGWGTPSSRSHRKPPPQGPSSSSASSTEEAGLPPGVCNVVLGTVRRRGRRWSPSRRPQDRLHRLGGLRAARRGPRGRTGGALHARARWQIGQPRLRRRGPGPRRRGVGPGVHAELRSGL